MTHNNYTNARMTPSSRDMTSRRDAHLVSVVSELVGVGCPAPLPDVHPHVGGHLGRRQEGAVVGDTGGVEQAVLPAGQRQALALRDAGDTLHEALHQLPGRVGAALEGEAGGRLGPRPGGQLVPPEVEGLQRLDVGVHRFHAAEEVLDEGVRRLDARVDAVVGEQLDGDVLGPVVGVGEEELARRRRVGGGETAVAGSHGGDGGARVARHVERRDYLDVTLSGVSQDLSVVGRRVEPAARVLSGGAGAELRRQTQRLAALLVTTTTPNLTRPT